MLSLAKTASNYDACIKLSVLGNALGNSLVDRIGSPGQVTRETAESGFSPVLLLGRNAI